MINPYKQLPIDRTGIPMQEFATPFTALATVSRENAATSSIIILNEDTSTIEVTASGGPAMIKWLSQATVDSSVAGTSVISAAGTANFDNAIATDQTRRFAVPRVAQGTGWASIQGTNREEGLYPNMATIGTASVLVTQY